MINIKPGLPIVLIVENNEEHSKSLASEFLATGAKEVYTEKTVAFGIRRLQMLKNSGINVTYAVIDNKLQGPMGINMATYIKRHYPKVRVGIIGITVMGAAIESITESPIKETTLDYSSEALRRYRQAIVKIEREEDLKRAIREKQDARREFMANTKAISAEEALARDKMMQRFEALFVEFFTANKISKRGLLKEIQHVHKTLYRVPARVSEITKRWKEFKKANKGKFR